MLIYLYCLAESSDARAPESVEKLAVENFVVVASRVSEEEFGEARLKQNLSRLDWVERAARHHESVMETLRAQTTIVPFRFPTLFRSEESLREFLRERQGALKELLERLRGKEEWGVKAYVGAKRLEEALAASEAIKRLDEELKNASPGKAYLLKKKRETLASESLAASLQEALDALYAKLQAQSAQAKRNPLLPKTVTERDDEMILNAAFLVEQAKRDDFLTAFDATKTSYPFLSLELSGPWAAYNFCNLKLDQR